MDELEQLERDGWQALSGPEGAAFYAEVMHDEGVMVFPGMVMDKTAALETMRSVAPWSSFKLSDIHVLRPAPDSGVVVYRANAIREGKEYEASMASVYVRRGDAWVLVLHQQSP